MSRRLRVFLSSTMKDLRSERKAVRDRITLFNFEPVNAEDWEPTGTRSWERIQDEVRSCDLFVLILGERYGWIPPEGPMAETGLSVTHLEFKEARSLGLPILPFLKDLAYDVDRSSEDARKRDAFRAEVESWGAGLQVAKFDYYDDLADSVGRALIQCLAEGFLRKQIHARAETATRAASSLSFESVATREFHEESSLTLPADLPAAVSSRKVVLFAGSGISLTAGLPSASAFSERMLQILREEEPAYFPSLVGGAFSGIATDLEAALGRKRLFDAVKSLMQPPQGLSPTPSHRQAVRLFDRILTSNYDLLFEQAAALAGLRPALVTAELERPEIPPHAIVKLHGSIDQLGSLVITEQDVLLFDRTHPNLWAAALDLLRKYPLLIVGSSLRDPSIVRLFLEAGHYVRGFFVAPQVSGPTVARLRSWGLDYIAAEADHFFETLAHSVQV